jgi:hypothetical protein
MDFIPITDAEIGGFEPIEGLTKGDKLVWRGPEFCLNIAPKQDEVVIVHRVLAPNERVPGEAGSVYEATIKDFTVLFHGSDDGKILEFCFDSRRFRRV